jgi:phasin family protein
MSNTTTTAALENGQAAASQTFDRTMSGLKDGVAQATAGLEQAQATMRTTVEKAMKTGEELISFSQGNLEAVTRASQIFATGMQDLTQHYAATAKASLEEAMSSFKALSSAKSIKEAMEIQSLLMRGIFEKAVSQHSFLTDSSIKLSEQTLAPITARVTLATEKFSRIG